MQITAMRKEQQFPHHQIAAQLPQIGSRVSSSVRSRDSFFNIYFDGEKVYTDDKSDARISDTHFSKNLTTGNKNYVIKEESQKHYIYVTSQSVIDAKKSLDSK